MLQAQFVGLDLSKLWLFGSGVNILELTVFETCINHRISVTMTLPKHTRKMKCCWHLDEQVSTEISFSLVWAQTLVSGVGNPEGTCVQHGYSLFDTPANLFLFYMQ